MNILIAEDDNYYSSYIEYSVKLTGEHEIGICSNSKELLNKLDDKVDLLFFDFFLDETDGMSLFSSLKLKFPNLEIVVVSGQQDVEIAVALLQRGAFDYIVKNQEAKNRIIMNVQKLEKQLEMRSTISQLESEVNDKYHLHSLIVSRDKSIEPVYNLINKAAKNNINVSIYGLTGTGKELVAKAIHYNSDRRNKPFIAVNLAALSENLIESELFGFEKGSFTGANERKVGRFEEAKDGTLFLDEISEVPLNIQVKLLRVLQEREINRIGSNQPIALQCRIICASNKNLKKEVQNGTFREDLYFRLFGLPIELPPLSERGNDVIHLTRHFMDEFSSSNKSQKYSISDAAVNKLKSYNFPGNVRELKSIIELACVLSDNFFIEDNNVRIETNIENTNFVDSNLSLKEMNERIIKSMLEKHNNVRLVADKLGIGKSTIYRLIQDNDLNNLSA